MSRSLYENHWGSPTLTLLSVLGVLGVLNVLCVLHVLHVLNMLMDASMACWALFHIARLFFCLYFSVFISGAALIIRIHASLPFSSAGRKREGKLDEAEVKKDAEFRRFQVKIEKARLGKSLEEKAITHAREQVNFTSYGRRVAQH